MAHFWQWSSWNLEQLVEHSSQIVAQSWQISLACVDSISIKLAASLQMLEHPIIISMCPFREATSGSSRQSFVHSLQACAHLLHSSMQPWYLSVLFVTTPIVKSPCKMFYLSCIILTSHKTFIQARVMENTKQPRPGRTEPDVNDIYLFTAAAATAVSEHLLEQLEQFLTCHSRSLLF